MSTSSENLVNFNGIETATTQKLNEILDTQPNTPIMSEVLETKIQNASQPISQQDAPNPSVGLSQENSLLHHQLMVKIKEMIVDSVKELRKMTVKSTPQPKEDEEALTEELKKMIVKKPKLVTPPIIKDGMLMDVPITTGYTNDISSILQKDKVKPPEVKQTPVHVRQQLEEQTEQEVVKQQRNITTQVATIEKSFTLPDKFLTYAKTMDEVSAAQSGRQRITQPTQNRHKFTIFERLDGWHIERRQRATGRYDTYYHHRGSKLPLRSTQEVVNFIVSETIPDKKQKGTSYENFSAQGRTSYERNLLLRRQVEKFLDSSLHNMDYQYNNDRKVPKETKRKRARKLKAKDFVSTNQGGISSGAPGLSTTSTILVALEPDTIPVVPIDALVQVDAPIEEVVPNTLVDVAPTMTSFVDNFVDEERANNGICPFRDSSNLPSVNEVALTFLGPGEMVLENEPKDIDECISSLIT